MNTARSTSTSSPKSLGPEGLPWQLKLFSKSLKKKQKLALLLGQIEDSRDLDCLLITHGDNNGALNFHFRAHGGRWTWVENEAKRITEMEELLGDEVLAGAPSRIPVDDASFDLAVSIDVHEHLDVATGFNRELHRVVRPGGRVIVTTPNGDPWKPVSVLKHWTGMTKEVYGHKVLGYNVEQHEAMLEKVGLEPIAAGSYSRFFTELVELAINLTYVKILSRLGGSKVEVGVIAPSSREQLRTVERQYRFYALIYPALYAISRLDLLLFPLTGYAVSVVSRKPQ
jgi:SAM-dependent methyltransferase